jgi:hypothetical protein
MHFSTAEFSPPSRPLRSLILMSVPGLAAGFIFLWSYPATVDPVSHSVWTFIRLMGVIVIEPFSCFAVREMCTVDENVTRCCLVFGEFAFLLVCSLTDVFMGMRARIALAAISEYAILVLLPMFFFSFSADLVTFPAPSHPDRLDLVDRRPLQVKLLGRIWSGAIHWPFESARGYRTIPEFTAALVAVPPILIVPGVLPDLMQSRAPIASFGEVIRPPRHSCVCFGRRKAGLRDQLCAARRSSS